MQNLDSFFQHFAIAVTARLPGGNVTFRAIFDNDDISPATIGQTQADLHAPRLTVKTADAAPCIRDTILEFSSAPEQPATAYRVLENHPDGTGITTLILAPYTARQKSAAELHSDLLQ